MFPSLAVSEEIIQKAIFAVQRRDEKSLVAINSLPIAVYATDADGYLTYFNQSCATFAGRMPRLGEDRWCVTWKLFKENGEYLPHDQCPMATALRAKSNIRGIRAIAQKLMAQKRRSCHSQLPLSIARAWSAQ
jgi:hypothetical protein